VLDAAYFEQENALNTSASDCLLTLIASASVDSTVKIWSRSSDYNLNEPGKSLIAKFNVMQTFSSKQNGFSLALKFHLLSKSNCKYSF
jgi:hypothetical protein